MRRLSRSIISAGFLFGVTLLFCLYLGGTGPVWAQSDDADEGPSPTVTAPATEAVTATVTARVTATVTAEVTPTTEATAETTPTIEAGAPAAAAETATEAAPAEATEVPEEEEATPAAPKPTAAAPLTATPASAPSSTAPPTPGAAGAPSLTSPKLTYPPADLACRKCHGDKTDEFTFSSGMTMTLGVDLAAVDASPHSSSSPTGAVACNNCHQNETRYRYPHVENPAQNEHEFALAVSNNCQSCHYPHLPFHDAEQSEYTPPACVDCHGSHAIDRVENIVNSMPGNCVKCHTDQTAEWATELIAPRPGFGAGAEGYIGSARCQGCHEDKYGTWQHTQHAKLVQDPAHDPTAIVGDFTKEDPALSFGPSDIAYTLGSRWSQLYITQTVSNTFEILPAQWIVATGKWEPYHPDDWETRDWRQECGSCHVTGLETQNWTFTEFGVGCESCHGPGQAHAADPENVKPFAAVDDQVCGACHSRGQSPDGHPFPATYRPGEPLTDHFTFATSEDALWPDGSAKLHEQQYMDWTLDNTMVDSGKVNCTTCHAVHDTGAAEGQIVKPLNQLCVDCHEQQGALVRHTPFHEAAIQKHEFNCTDCHMPKLATNATPFDTHSHAFMQPNPQGSIDHGGVAAMPNACNQCHQGAGETAQWAAQTIAVAQARATPVAGAFFGPGPTPTSPPPPTPIAAVGPPAEFDKLENGVWIRRSVYIATAIVVVLAVAWAFYRFRSRGKQNA